VDLAAEVVCMGALMLFGDANRLKWDILAITV